MLVVFHLYIDKYHARVKNVGGWAGVHSKYKYMPYVLNNMSNFLASLHTRRERERSHVQIDARSKFESLDCA